MALFAPFRIAFALLSAAVALAAAPVATGAWTPDVLVSQGAINGNGPFDATCSIPSIDSGRCLFSSDGSRVFFHTDEQLVPTDVDGAFDVYERSGAGLRLVSGGTDIALPAYLAGISADGSRAFFQTRESLDPDDLGGLDVYQWQNGLITRITGGSPNFDSRYRGVSPDGTQVFFESGQMFSGADLGTKQDIYRRSGSTFTLISGGSSTYDAFFGGASADWSRIFFNTAAALVASDTDGAIDVYERSGTTLALTRLSGGTAAEPASFQFASADGSRVYFRTVESLAAGDVNTSEDGYRASAGAITLVTGGTDDGRIEAISADGSRAFFTTREELLPEDDDGFVEDVYEWSAGGLTLISGGTANEVARLRGVSADGTRVIFVTREALLPADVDAAQDVYERAGGTLTLVSPGTAGLDAISTDISDDGGLIFFTTNEALLPADLDTARDVYVRNQGTLELVSCGRANVDASFELATSGGGQVLFSTAESLLAADADSARDLYVARQGALCPSPVLPDVVDPLFGFMSANLGRFAAAPRGGSIQLRVSVGKRVVYTLSESATTTFTVERARPGRRVGGKCVPPKPSNRKARPCTRYVRMKGQFQHAGVQGSNSFRFTGRLRGRKLPPGSYRLVGVARDGANNSSGPARTKFRIVRR